MTAPGARTFKLSPSDFAFLWEECKRCFYLKVTGTLDRPRAPFPGIFGVIDEHMKICYEGRRTESIAPGMPPGVIGFGDKWVRSRPVELPGRSASCFILGRLDTIATLDDHSYAVIDFKTSAIKPSTAEMYSRQLHAYALALEHPDGRSFSLSPISTLGLLVFEPTGFEHEHESEAKLAGPITWIDIPRDDETFHSFLDEVVSVLEAPEPPEPADDCTYCHYLVSGRP